MDLTRLLYVVSLAEEKNFTKAAEKLYIAQPSLSQAIKNEEDRIGFKLFDRSTSPLKITNEGLEYIRWAKNILESCEEMNKRMDELSAEEDFYLTIGILPEFNSFILTEPLMEFYEKYPNSSIKVVERSTNDLQKDLKDSKLDFAISIVPNDDYNYVSKPLYDEEIVLALTSEFLPKNKDCKYINIEDYRYAPFIVMEEGQFLYNTTMSLCQRHNFIPRTILECYNLETALHFVKRGIGVSIVPDLMCKVMGGIKYYSIPGETPESQISIIYRKDRYLTKKSMELINIIQSYIENNVLYSDFLSL